MLYKNKELKLNHLLILISILMLATLSIAATNNDQAENTESKEATEAVKKAPNNQIVEKTIDIKKAEEKLEKDQSTEKHAEGKCGG